DAAGARDLAHAGAVKAEIHKDLARAVEDLSALGAFLFAGSRMLVWMNCNHWFSFWQEIPRLRRPGGRFGLMFHCVGIYVDRTVRSMIICAEGADPTGEAFTRMP